MDRDQIIQQVKMRMDELSPFNDGLIVYAASPAEELAHTKPIQYYIDATLDESNREMLLVAPLNHIPLVDFDFGTLHADISVVNNIGRFTLPDDFLRLGWLKFNVWERPVFDTISNNDPNYKLQLNEFTRGGYGKPIVSVTKYPPSRIKILEMFTISDTDKTTGVGAYVAEEPVGNDTVPDILVPALSWLTAGKVFQIMEKAGPSQAALQQFQAQLTLLSK
jgi:hypothetical protein